MQFFGLVLRFSRNCQAHPGPLQIPQLHSILVLSLTIANMLINVNIILLVLILSEALASVDLEHSAQGLF